ncbi:MAG: hypothetical protein JOZ17_23115 [Acetobacteraceae bacterium]|nr:hypothetical protein [Acetobacteraceae bacterium]
MALIPPDADVCCTMDMDRFLAPGWRPKLEAAWTPDTTALYCRVEYRASVDDPTTLRGWPARNFHSRWGYRFKRPVHEALFFTGEKEVERSCQDIVVYEVQDRSKPTRSQYLPLMEVAYREDPDDSQICFWLGRDYVWANRHAEGIELLRRYLSLPTSTWTEERSEAMRYLARMEADKRMFWLDKARLEAPHRRETWLDLAEEVHGRAEWLDLFWACINGIEKTWRTGSYLDDDGCWGARLFELGAAACWHLGVMDRAAEWGKKAADLDPGNQRLQDKLDFFIRQRKAVRLGKVNIPADAPRTRFFTTSGNVVYVDAASGQLRHGAVDGSPANVVFVADQSRFDGARTGWLMHDSSDGPAPIGCSAEGCWSACATDTSGAFPAPTAFQLVPLERGLVGLEAGGRYLCAEPDGRLTLSRARCSLWECFLTSEAWCAAPLPDGAEQARTTIDWGAIRSFVISPHLDIVSRGSTNS